MVHNITFVFSSATACSSRVGEVEERRFAEEFFLLIDVHHDWAAGICQSADFHIAVDYQTDLGGCLLLIVYYLAFRYSRERKLEMCNSGSPVVFAALLGQGWLPC